MERGSKRPGPRGQGIEEAEELSGRSGRLSADYRRCLQTLGALPERDLKNRQEFVDRAAGELGYAAGRFQVGGWSEQPVCLDLFPRVLRAREWERIEAGVLQRARAFSAYVADVYGKREILRAGVVPPERVLEDPAFHPELHGVPLAEGGAITVGAFDLVRAVSGEWQVLENRISTPTGIAVVIHTRRILAQALPELFSSLHVVPVAGFASRLSEALSEQVPSGLARDPLTVLLSEGEASRHFFEESFLARHMGIPLARPQDLVVRQGKVFLRTIAGLLEVDVIHRRMESSLLDPVAFAGADGAGLPGLVQCVRQGSVRVANALGCAVADNRAVLPSSDAIIRFYTGERALLRTVPTFTGYDRDHQEWMEEHRHEALLKPVCQPSILRWARPECASLLEPDHLASLLRADPRLVVAQRLPQLARLPVLEGGRFSPQALGLRVFFILGRRPQVLPGGLSRSLAGVSGSSRELRFKDTWALRQSRVEANRGGRLEPRLRLSQLPLPSRAAEGAYWIGRYLERACGTARMLSLLHELRGAEQGPSERALYAPLYRALALSTGQKRRWRPSDASGTAKLIHGLLLEATNPASIPACLEAAEANANGIRSFITPEFWRALQAARGLARPPSRPRPESTEARALLESVVEACDRVYGAGERTLLHDAGWHFLNLGLLLERAQTHVGLLQAVLPHIARRQWQHLRDDTDLTALLRLLGALDAYHRRYRSRAYLDRVAHLLWQSPDCTGSVMFALRGMEQSLRSVVSTLEEAGEGSAFGLLPEVEVFIRWLESIPLESIFPARSVELDRGLTRRNLSAERTIREAERCLEHMRLVLDRLHLRMEDAFFSHHAAPEGRD